MQPGDEAEVTRLIQHFLHFFSASYSVSRICSFTRTSHVCFRLAESRRYLLLSLSIAARLSLLLFLTSPKNLKLENKVVRSQIVEVQWLVSFTLTPSVGPGRSKSKIKKSDTLAGHSQHTISIYMRFETFSNILQQDSSVMARWWIIKCLFRCAEVAGVFWVSSTLLLHTCITFTMSRFTKINI